MLTCMYSRVQIFVGEACSHSKETRLKPDFCLEFYPYKVHISLIDLLQLSSSDLSQLPSFESQTWNSPRTVSVRLNANFFLSDNGAICFQQIILQRQNDSIYVNICNAVQPINWLMQIEDRLFGSTHDLSLSSPRKISGIPEGTSEGRAGLKTRIVIVNSELRSTLIQKHHLILNLLWSSADSHRWIELFFWFSYLQHL